MKKHLRFSGGGGNEIKGDRKGQRMGRQDRERARGDRGWDEKANASSLRNEREKRDEKSTANAFSKALRHQTDRHVQTHDMMLQTSTWLSVIQKLLCLSFLAEQHRLNSSKSL